jgi:DNA replication protein DnaC
LRTESSTRVVPRCGACNAPIWQPNAHELEQLPSDWVTRGLCPECCLVAPADLARRETPEVRAERIIDSRLRRSGLPEVFASARLEDIETDGRGEVLSALHEWIRGDLRGLFLCGPVGTGKTFMAAAAARARLTRSHVSWVSAPRFVLDARAQYGSPELSRSSNLLAARSDLVLDDLGQENPTPSAQELLFAAVDERLNSGRSLLITSNLTQSELGERYGLWLPSRLQTLTAFRVSGPDRRLTGDVYAPGQESA